ncbi:MAG: Mu-like prophage FluMu protein gp41 [Syntrophus sp. PtaB.Bin001]|nr:MAG: Mu-like prophage FluMu protein gp41 [Syntrophus sp. PtaB.Bin001]
MITQTVMLKKGLKVGEVVHREAEIREATGGDFIDATEESERLCQTPEGGYILVASPTLVGLNTLRRQIVRIGEHEGPLTLAELKMLSGRDIRLLQETAEKLENASLAEVADRGEG